MSRAARWWVAGAVVLILGAGLLVASVGGSGSPQAARVNSGEAGSGTEVAALTLDSLEGKRLDVPSGRPGALFFTVSSCVSCIPSARALGELKAKLGDRADVVWVGIDPSDPPDAVRARRKSLGDPAYPFAIDGGGTLAGRYGVTALGTTVVYNAEGRIVARLIEPNKEQLASAFKQAGAS
jgi:thiol-disulfide isomerase/thioredoxin